MGRSAVERVLFNQRIKKLYIGRRGGAYIKSKGKKIYLKLPNLKRKKRR